MLGQHDEIAFILAIVIIDNDEKFASFKAVKGIGEIIRHEQPPLR
jgi:hypothetical protein